MKFFSILCIATVAFFTSCNNKSSGIADNNYFLDTDTAAVKTGGIQMVSINTPRSKGPAKAAIGAPCERNTMMPFGPRT